jgi:hypothetical protein
MTLIYLILGLGFFALTGWMTLGLKRLGEEDNRSGT